MKQPFTKFRLALLSLIFILGLSACKKEGEQLTQNPVIPVTYPTTAKTDSASTHFGTGVPDPFRWLEDDNSEQTAAWVKSQNDVTGDYLSKIPYREKVRARLTELYNYPRYGSPFRAGEYYFFYKNDGLQNQSVLYFQKGLEGTPEVFIDPNSYSADGTVTLNLSGFSKDKKYATFQLSESGSDWSKVVVFEVATKKQLKDEIKWVKFSGTSWYKDGFFYSRFPEPAPGKVLTVAVKDQRVYYHKLGTPQAQDKLIFETPAAPGNYNGAGVTDDERFLILSSSKGTYGNELYVKRLDLANAPLLPIATGYDNEYGVVDSYGDKLLIQTDKNAPNQQVVLVDPANPAPDAWKTIIAEDKKNSLANVNTAGGKLFVFYLQDVSTHVYQYSYEGKRESEIKLPAIGNAGGFGGEKEDKEVFYTFSSFTYPPTIFRYDIASGKSTEFRKAEVKFNPADYETKQVFYTSKDGTKIPMFIVHKKGIKLDGNHPTYLYAYGGFSISLTPNFSPLRIMLLENGGVFAQANLRGGGEFGEDWHKSGMLDKKQNVFDDFIAAGEYLVKEGYTTPQHLAIAGGSNGGLLVGAVMAQRPDLFAVALPAVGVMDMLRYQKFSAGRGWMVEYGSADSTDQMFKTLYAYSPLHNLKEGVKYPATMVTTADHDDRVVPAHSFKFAARLQEAHKGENPVLIRIESKAGHGAGKPTSKIIEEQTDIWSFMFYNTGVKDIIGPPPTETNKPAGKPQ